MARKSRLVERNLLVKWCNVTCDTLIITALNFFIYVMFHILSLSNDVRVKMYLIKQSICLWYTDKSHYMDYTIAQYVPINHNSYVFVLFLIKMQVWDTAGQERFRTLTQGYYRSAHGAMIAYDLTRHSTFESLPHWIQEVEQYGAASIVVIFIGTVCSQSRALTSKISNIFMASPLICLFFFAVQFVTPR